jgi:hypothetical protein
VRVATFYGLAGILSVGAGDVQWEFEDENEFFSAYRPVEVSRARYSVVVDKLRLTMFFMDGTTIITVAAAVPKYVLPKEQRDARLKQSLVLFVGHGRSPQWRDLKDHLQDKHGFRVEGYETGARAGFTIVEVLQRLAKEASFALLVLTAEDEDPTGQLHARENVIHEAGLFQGTLGFSNVT